MNQQPTVQEIREIVMAEYKYWVAVDKNLAISAVGACANILCAIDGFRAPWHPQASPNPSEEQGQWSLDCGCSLKDGVRNWCYTHRDLTKT